MRKLSRLMSCAVLFGSILVSTSGQADVVSGTATATFQNPVPGSAVTTGVGTSNFTFGTPAGVGSFSSALSFVGGAFNGVTDTPFLVGTLTFLNGAIAFGTEATAVDLALSLNFAAPGLGVVPSTFTLGLITTPNTSDPDASADFVTLPTSFGGSSFVIGSTTYHVQLTGFDNIVGDGFLGSDSTQLHVREGSSATAQLFAEVTSRVAPVPEPSTWAMMFIGFAGVGFMAYRQARKSSRVALDAA